jgi:hypothetical protein
MYRNETRRPAAGQERWTKIEHPCGLSRGAGVAPNGTRNGYPHPTLSLVT